MTKFLVLYCMPAGGLDEWMKLPEEVRKGQEDSLKAQWDVWAKANAGTIKDTGGAGKTKRVTTSGVADAKNDVMLYSIIETDSHEAAANMFAGHPHLTIPGAWIDVMPMNQLPGMA